MRNPLPKQEYNLIDLYKTILEFGSECISCGVCYSDFKQLLIAKGFVAINQETNEPIPEMEEYIEYWFLANFLHADKSCSCPEEDFHKCYGVDRKKHIENCTFFMAQTSCMNLLALKEAENNRKAAADNLVNTEKSLKIAEESISYAKLSLFTSAFIFLISSIHTYYKSNDKSLSEILSLLNAINNKHYMIVPKVDSIAFQTHNSQNDSLYQVKNKGEDVHKDTVKNSISSLKRK